MSASNYHLLSERRTDPLLNHIDIEEEHTAPLETSNQIPISILTNPSSFQHKSCSSRQFSSQNLQLLSRKGIPQHIPHQIFESPHSFMGPYFDCISLLIY